MEAFGKAITSKKRMLSFRTKGRIDVTHASIDYNDFFDHVKGLKKVLLISGGRSGSDFFQSLLDRHSEILQFPGTFFFHQWWEEAKCKENLFDLLNEFIWHSTGWSNHIAFFKSYYNRIERWDQLGENKNEYFEVDIDSFKKHMLGIFSEIEINRKNFFIAVHLAYGLASNIDVNKTKILFYHIHHIEKLEEFKEDFLSFDIIFTIREPRNLLVSDMEHWKIYDSKSYNSYHLYRILKRIFDESEPILKYTKDVKTLKLEDLHLFHQDVLKEYCQSYGLTFEKNMLESTWHGKKWWGDAISGKYLDGFNKKIRKKKWIGKIFFHDNLLIGFLLEDRLKHYGYVFETKPWRLYYLIIPCLIFLPMKYELKTLIHNMKQNKRTIDKFISVGMLMQSYFMRIILYFNYLIKKIRGEIYIAETFFQRTR